MVITSVTFRSRYNYLIRTLVRGFQGAVKWGFTMRFGLTD